MSARKKRGNPYSWQIKRLLEFADYEKEEAKLYELYFEKMAEKIPYKVLSVMVFFSKEHYRKKPGTLVALYRITHCEEGIYIPFVERFERYYEVLHERGCL